MQFLNNQKLLNCITEIQLEPGAARKSPLRRPRAKLKHRLSFVRTSTKNNIKYYYRPRSVRQKAVDFWLNTVLLGAHCVFV